VTVTAAATFCATLVDEFARRGITHAFVAPGSRSTPLLLALDADRRIDVHIFHDERSASFAALGYANTTGTPGIVLCTSGTATAHFYAAIIEADQSGVPMIVCTADRPPELWARGAPQTIDQTRMYGKSPRLFVQPGPADDGHAATWRPLAADIADHAAGFRGARPGPVHANLSFRDPLVGEAGPLPDPLDPSAPTPRPSVADSEAVAIAELCRGRKGVVVAGRGTSSRDDLHLLARRLGWPIIADHQSGARTDDTIAHADTLLRHPPFAASRRPEVILRFGESLSSKALSQWMAACAAGGCDVVSLHQPGRLIDPETIATLVAPEDGAAAAIVEHLGHGNPVGDAEAWLAADHMARSIVSEALEASHDSELAVAIGALHAAGADGIVVAASSMPVRYLEWFDSHPPPGTRVLSNRGANGIDGVIATSIGVALTGAPTVCLVGDIAFLHDASSLTALSRRPIDLTVVVIDNDGGGIFSFLPQADGLEPDRFDRLFGTPHGTDLVALAAAHGIDATDDTTDLSPRGVRVIVARTAQRPAHVELVRAINDAVASTLDP
jgi:2-succinyl-5-enolpyruvyl-6-hydroxy-3-cyclohexene-1-carboxylate synthase